EVELDVVAAPIFVVGAVERLVHVAHEMYEEQEGLPALYGCGSRVHYSPLEFFDFGDYAVAFRAIAGHVEVRPADRNIDIVPRSGHFALAPDLIGPTGDRWHGISVP